jgi:hypothetical protein
MTKTKPPPYDAPSEVMTKWVLDLLYAEDLDTGLEILLTKIVPEIEQEDEEGSLDYLIEIAEEYGDIGPMREILSDLLPALAKTPTQARGLKYIVEHFLHLTSRGPNRRGHSFKQLLGKDHVADALEDAKRITALWQQTYGKSRRGRGLVTADEIAAERYERHGVTVAKMNTRRGNKRKPKPRT